MAGYYPRQDDQAMPMASALLIADYPAVTAETSAAEYPSMHLDLPPAWEWSRIDPSTVEESPSLNWDPRPTWGTFMEEPNMTARHSSMTLTKQVPGSSSIPDYTTVTNSVAPQASTSYDAEDTAIDGNEAEDPRAKEPLFPGLSLSLGLPEHLIATRHSIMQHQVPASPKPPTAIIKSAPPTLAAKMSQPSDGDWERHRPLITQLYKESTLKKVMKHLKEERGFTAT